MNRSDFLSWELASRDTIDVKRAYIDIAGDLVAGTLLSQIVYWHLPAKSGQDRLRVRRDGQDWIAKGRADWWDEIRITARQFDRACNILEERGLVVAALYKFAGTPTKHVRINWPTFLEAIAAHGIISAHPDYGKLHKGENPFYAKGKIHFTEVARSFTETTPETTPETTGSSAVPAQPTEEEPADAWLNETRIPADLPPLDLETLSDEEKAAIASPAAPEPAPTEDRAPPHWQEVMRAKHRRYTYQRGYTWADDVVPLIERFSEGSGIQPPDVAALSKQWHAGTVTLLYQFDTQLNNGDGAHLNTGDRRALTHWCVDLFFSDDNPVDYVTPSTPHSLIKIAGNLAAFLHGVQDYCSLGRAGRPTAQQIQLYVEYKGGHHHDTTVMGSNETVRSAADQAGDQRAREESDAGRRRRLRQARDGR